MKCSFMVILALTVPSFGQQYLPLSGGTLTGPLSVPSLNNVLEVDQFAGSTADQKIINCLDHLPSLGGICDARGFGATTQTIASTVTAGNGVKQILIFSPATTFIPASDSVSPLFNFGPNASVTGLSLNICAAGQQGCLAKFNYSGTAINVVGTSTFNNVNFSLSDILIYAYGNINAYDIVLMPSAGQNISFYNFHNITMVGGLYGHYFNSSNSYINNNSFTNETFDGAVHGIYFVGGSGTNTIFENSWSNIQFQWGSGITKEFVYCTGGVNTVQLNSLTGLQEEDVPGTPSIIMHDSACNSNYFQGSLLSSFQDLSPAHLNIFIDHSSNQNWDMGNSSLGNIRNLAVNGNITASGGVVLNSNSGAMFISTNGVPTGSCVHGSVGINTAPSSASTVLYVCYPDNSWNPVITP